MQGDKNTLLAVKGRMLQLLICHQPIRLNSEMLLNLLPRQSNKQLSLLNGEHRASCWFGHKKGVYSIAVFNPVNAIVTEERPGKRLQRETLHCPLQRSRDTDGKMMLNAVLGAGARYSFHSVETLQQRL
jgi:hypothetical protein